MTRTRTVPQTRDPIAKDTLESFQLQMAYNADATGNPSQVVFRYRFNHRAADGTIINSSAHSVLHANWTAGLQTAIEALIAQVLIDAETEGYITAGTDTDELPGP